MFTYDLDIVSDLYKESHGFRPSGEYMSWLHAQTPETIQKVWDDLFDDAAEEGKRYEERQMRARADFEAQVNKILTTVIGSTREDALRYIADAYGAFYYGTTNIDVEYLEYLTNVGYGYISGRNI